MEQEEEAKVGLAYYSRKDGHETDKANNEFEATFARSILHVELKTFQDGLAGEGMTMLFSQCLWNEEQDKECRNENLSHGKRYWPDIAHFIHP